MRSKYLAAIHVAFALVLAAITSVSAEEVEFAAGEYPPYISENMEGQGIVSQVVTEACKRAGITPRVKFYPWTRSYSKVKEGQAQASFLWLRTEERLTEVAYSEYHVQEGPTAVFYKKSSFPEGINFTSYADLMDYKVVGVASYWYEGEFKKLGKENVHYVAAEDLALKILSKGRADVYVSDMLVGIHLAKQVLGEDAEEIGYSQLQQKPSKGFLIYPKDGSDELRVKLDNALKSMHEDGTFAKIMGL